MNDNSKEGILMVTSGFNFDNYAITDYLGFCSGECALGTGFFSALEAGISDLLGANSNLYAEKLEGAKQFALRVLLENAKNLGANAVIGIDIDYTTFSSDIVGVIANGTAVIIEPLKSKLPSSLKIDIENYNPDLPFQVVTLLLSCLKGEFSFSLTLTGDSKETITALKANIVLSDIFGDEFDFGDFGFADFKKIPNSNQRISSSSICKIPQKILPFINSAHVIVKKYIADGVLHTATDNDLLWKEKRQRDISESISLGLDVDAYIAHIPSLSSAAEIMEYTQKINEGGSLIHPDLLKIISSQVNLERMYGNLKDSCIEEIMKYFSSEDI